MDKERILKQTDAIRATLGLMVATGEISKNTKETLEIGLNGIGEIISQEQSKSSETTNDLIKDIIQGAEDFKNHHNKPYDNNTLKNCLIELRNKIESSEGEGKGITNIYVDLFKDDNETCCSIYYDKKIQMNCFGEIDEVVDKIRHHLHKENNK